MQWNTDIKDCHVENHRQHFTCVSPFPSLYSLPSKGNPSAVIYLFGRKGELKIPATYTTKGTSRLHGYQTPTAFSTKDFLSVCLC